MQQLELIVKNLFDKVFGDHSYFTKIIATTFRAGNLYGGIVRQKMKNKRLRWIKYYCLKEH